MVRVRMVLRFLLFMTCLASVSLKTGDGLADESKPTGSVSSDDSGEEVTAGQTAPAIPYRVLTEVSPGFGRDLVELSDEQKRVIGEIRDSGYKVSMYCNRLRSMTADIQSTLLETALKLIEQDAEDQAAHSILAVLSREQISQIRSKKRGAIVQAESQRLTQSVPKPPAHKQTMYSIGSYMYRNDLVSLLEGTDALDALQLSDEQFASVQEIRKQAWPHAMSTAKECVELLRLDEEQKLLASQAVAADGGPIQKILDRTIAVLNEEQRVAYKERIEQRHKDLQRNPPKDPLDMMTAFKQHAMPEEIRTVIHNGQAAISIRLFNYFAVPENAQALEVSSEQQAKIAALLIEAEQEAVKSMMEAHVRTQGSDAELNTQISAVVTAFHQKSFDAIFSLLTEQQIEILQEKKRHQLGLEALRLPEVRGELNLSEAQSSELDTILNRRMPQPDSTLVVSDSESKRMHRSIPKNQDEAMKQFEEQKKEFDAKITEEQKRFQTFSRQRHQDIWSLLNDEQRAKLTSLTGVSAPAESKPGI